MTSRLTKVITRTLCLGIMFGIGLCIHSDRASAVKATDFNAGNIIDDSVFYNKDAMTLTEIEQFIKDHTGERARLARGATLTELRLTPTLQEQIMPDR